MTGLPEAPQMTQWKASASWSPSGVPAVDAASRAIRLRSSSRCSGVLPLGGPAGHERLDHEPRIHQVAVRRTCHAEEEPEGAGEVLRVDRADLVAALVPGLDADDAERLEDAQRLADRDAADAESLGQLGLRRQPVAGLEVAAGNVLDDRARDPMGELGGTQPAVRERLVRVGSAPWATSPGGWVGCALIARSGRAPARQPRIFPSLPGIGFGEGRDGPARSTVR